MIILIIPIILIILAVVYACVTCTLGALISVGEPELSVGGIGLYVKLIENLGKT